MPFVVYVPPSFLASVPNRASASALLEAVHDRAEAHVVSLADSPTLVFALLSKTKELRAIPSEWRFHTFGGQATSPHFTFAERPTARLWGTDSAAFVFSASADGDVEPYENKNCSFSNAHDLDTMNPSLRGTAALLSSFAKGYLRRCEGQVRLRNEAATAIR